MRTIGLIAALLAALCALPRLGAVEFADELTPGAEAAIKKGLAALAKLQRADGSWGEWNGGEVIGTTGIAGACTLAFLANGQVPGEGEYGQVTAKAIDFLIKNSKPNGLVYGKGISPMYHHGLATLALAEAWGQSQDPKIRSAVKNAVDLICGCQNRNGGWRYNPVIGDDDLSVTVMQLMALRAAKDAGIEVPREVIEAGIEYVKRCHNGKGQGKDGGFAYVPGGESGFARTGAGVTSLQVAGNYKASEVSEGVEYLLNYFPLGTKKEDDNFYLYGLYYATMGLYQAQGIGSWGRKAWQSWYPAVVKSLVSTQQADGTWLGRHTHFDTAVGVLVLSIPCRYLPIYQR